MSNKHIEELLQHCIAAFDSGLSPEECLSAFPDRRAELEPLFRQAISLRVAFAASPRAEFRQRTRERLLFAAGRDVSAAFAAQPDPEFVNDARQRFIRAAGAEAQEALRAVPPPRLPFWVNTRRRLLEVAAASNSRPQPVARPLGGIFALRAGLSMAVVVLAVAVGGLAYTIGFNDPAPTNAQFAQLERELEDIEEDQKNGLVDSARLQEFTAKVDKLVQQSEHPQAVYEKLPDLISKQQQVIKAAASEGLLAPEVAQAQDKQLEQAAAVAELRLAAARADDPTATPVPPTSTPAITSTATTSATAETTPVPATSTPAPVATQPPVGVALTEGQLRKTDLGDKTQYESANLTFAVPEEWALQGGITFEDDFVQLDISELQFRIDAETLLRVDIETGQIQVFQGTTQYTIRSGGVRGEFIDNDELIAKAGLLVGDLRAMRESVVLSGALVPTPTPTPSPTPTTTVTPSPTATSTPEPSATP